MAVYCTDLFELKSFQQIRLCAGRNGLYRVVSWPYVCVTPTISQWLHGGELLFFSGSSFQTDEKSLELLLRECINQNLAGMVLLVDGESVLTVSDSLCRIADEASFPLFEMPWKLRLIDVTQEIAEMIIRRRGEINQSNQFLEQAFFTADDESKIDRLSSLYGVQTRPYAFVACISPKDDSSNAEFTQALLHKFSFLQTTCNFARSTTLLATRHLESVVCLGMANTQELLKKLSEDVINLFGMLDQQYFPNAGLQLGFSTLSSSSRICKLFREATKMIGILRQSGINVKVRFFRSLGLCRLFFDISNPELVREFCLETLEPLFRADQHNKSALIETLRSYLLNNCNLVKTAQALYIHRNTLLYRLEQIRELLCVDLGDPFVRNELFNSLLAADLLFPDNQVFR